MDALRADPFAAAILLAATAAGDVDARAAALDPALRARVSAVSSALAGHQSRGREAALGALIAASAPRAFESASAAPARARAIIASLTTRERGSAWMRDAGAPRVGFRGSPGLRTTIACTEDDAWRA